jgi:hypothetical protein
VSIRVHSWPSSFFGIRAEERDVLPRTRFMEATKKAKDWPRMDTNTHEWEARVKQEDDSWLKN